MKKIRFIAVACALALTLCALLASCGKKDKQEEPSAKKPDVFALELSEYIELGEYKNLMVIFIYESRAEAAWRDVIDGSEVKKYPEELVSYYTEQTQARYRYYAEKNDMEYAKVLEDFGATEESIVNEAKALAKADLVFAALVKAENITLSEEEKSEHFERYLEFYIESYGYTEEYVRENLAEEIYESMLYDKASEFLIINNSFPE